MKSLKTHNLNRLKFNITSLHHFLFIIRSTSLILKYSFGLFLLRFASDPINIGVCEDYAKKIFQFFLSRIKSVGSPE
jgi:hypothetical protein